MCKFKKIVLGVDFKKLSNKLSFSRLLNFEKNMLTLANIHENLKSQEDFLVNFEK